MTKPVYDILVVEDFEDKQGRKRLAYHRAGVAFENGPGGMNCEVYPGIALTGRFVIFPQERKGTTFEKTRPDDRRRD